MNLADIRLFEHFPDSPQVRGDVADFVSTTDLAPTFLEVAGLKPPEAMTGRSLMPLFEGTRSGRLAPKERPYVLTGKERRVPSQEAPDSGGYPVRALRNAEFLLIRNYAPQRWPNGTPHHEKAFIPGAWFGDCDNGPTKSSIIANKDKDEAHRKACELSFGLRPEFELYDLAKDPGRVTNVAGHPEYADVLRKLSARLEADLEKTGDPRALGTAKFDRYPYIGGAPKFPGLKKPKKK